MHDWPPAPVRLTGPLLRGGHGWPTTSDRLRLRIGRARPRRRQTARNNAYVLSSSVAICAWTTHVVIPDFTTRILVVGRVAMRLQLRTAPPTSRVSVMSQGRTGTS